MRVSLTQPRQNRRFTLLEVLIASLVLALMAGGIYGSITMSTKMIYSARQRIEAQSLAVDRCWIAYRDTYENLLNYPDVSTVAVPLGHSLFPFGGTVRTSVEKFGNPITYVRITVRLDWTENGLARYETFTVDRYDDR